MAGAPFGNHNAAKGKRWQQAIDRALSKRCNGDGIAALDELAEKFISAVAGGDKDMFPGFREFGDRLDGKPAQALEHSGPDGQPLIPPVINIVPPKSSDD